MLVYRIETEYGEGAFQAVMRDAWDLVDGADPRRHPNPRMDPGIDHEAFMVGLHYCGFASPRQLAPWFTRRHRIAIEKAFACALSVWWVDDADGNLHRGSFQVIFDRGRATLLGRIPLTTPLNVMPREAERLMGEHLARELRRD